jgi:hypothetical protein
MGRQRQQHEYRIGVGAHEDGKRYACAGGRMAALSRADWLREKHSHVVQLPSHLTARTIRSLAVAAFFLAPLAIFTLASTAILSDDPASGLQRRGTPIETTSRCRTFDRSK